MASSNNTSGLQWAPHPLEEVSQLHQQPIFTNKVSITSPPAALHCVTTPLAKVDVYMDNFIGMCQPATATQTL
jgi:hypothetical protein